jgi:16S rRNA (guanine527-N7)-methyltransferase
MRCEDSAESPEFGPVEFAAAANVSRETLGRLCLYADMLRDWNTTHNLVSKRSLDDLWRRHFLDSAQLAELMPAGARTLVDLGSGAGLPGLVLAELLRNRNDFKVVLIEATAKKCRFLEEVAERLELAIDIRNVRIEDAKWEAFDVVTARALAPLSQLLAYAQGFWAPRTTGLFLKGRNLGPELTLAHKSWSMNTREHPSRSDPEGVILEVRELEIARSRPKRPKPVRHAARRPA